MTITPKTVLVTGANGFLGKYCVLILLEKDYKVRGTIRNAAQEATLRETLGQHCGKLDQLELVTANLSADDGWEKAVSGCSFVMHVASPFPPHAPEHEDNLIIPARDGTLSGNSVETMNSLSLSLTSIWSAKLP